MTWRADGVYLAAVYPRALTVDEIHKHFESVVPPMQWPFPLFGNYRRRPYDREFDG